MHNKVLVSSVRSAIEIVVSFTLYIYVSVYLFLFFSAINHSELWESKCIAVSVAVSVSAAEPVVTLDWRWRKVQC